VTEFRSVGRSVWATGGRVEHVTLSWIADGPVGEDEVTALAFAFAGAIGTILGCWLAGLVL
jgi:hypothetical protein